MTEQDRIGAHAATYKEAPGGMHCVCCACGVSSPFFGHAPSVVRWQERHLQEMAQAAARGETPDRPSAVKIMLRDYRDFRRATTPIEQARALLDLDASWRAAWTESEFYDGIEPS